MASLNQLASGVTHDIGQPYNYVLLKRVKDMFIQNRATLLARSIDKKGVGDTYIQRYVVDLEDVDSADSCEVTLDCIVKRTSNKIATPLRIQGDAPFLLVGSANGFVVVTYASSITEVYTATNVMNVNNIPRYIYINGYGYFYNWDATKALFVAVYENPTLIYPETADDCTNGICYDDDMEFPCPIDLIVIIKEMIFKELGLIKEQPKAEVEIDTSKS